MEAEKSAPGKKVYLVSGEDGFDDWDEDEIKLHSKEVTSIDDLSEKFERLYQTYRDQIKDKANISVGVLPDKTPGGSEIVELSVHHALKRKMFSNEVKEQHYVLSVIRLDSDKIYRYTKETTDLTEVKNLFHEYIVTRREINLDGWKSREL